MNTEVIGDEGFVKSTAANGLVQMKEILHFPETASWLDANFLWHACTNTFDTPRSYLFLSGYTRLVLRLSGDNLLVNHDNNAHSHVVKKVCSFYEYV